MTQNEGLQNPNDRALYLFIQGPTKQSLDCEYYSFNFVVHIFLNS